MVCQCLDSIRLLREGSALQLFSKKPFLVHRFLGATSDIIENGDGKTNTASFSPCETLFSAWLYPNNHAIIEKAVIKQLVKFWK